MTKPDTTKDKKAEHDIAELQHKAAEAHPKPSKEAALTGVMTDEAKLAAEVDDKVETKHAADVDKKTHGHEGLVKMVKHDEAIHVHPTAVDAHKEAGWKHA